MTTTQSKHFTLLIASLLVPLFGLPDCNCRPGNAKNPDDGGCGTLCAISGIPAASGLDFGNVPIGQPVTLKFTLHNQGTALLNVTGASIVGTNAADFKLGGKLGPEVQQESASIASVTFTPATAGPLTASLTIETDGDPGTLNVSLTGVGIDVEICAHPNTIDFGNVQVLGTPSTTFNGDAGSIAICNCGLSPVSLTFPGIEGPQSSDFADTGESNSTLQPNQCENIVISYSPGTLGPSTADLPYGVCTGCPTQSINLTGVGVDGQLTFSPSPVNFGSPPPPPPAPTAQVVATNTGTENLALTNLGTYSGSNVFVVSGAPAMPLTMAPLQSFTFTVTYNTSGNSMGDQDELLGVFTVADPAVAPRTVQDLLSGNELLGPCSLGVTPSSVNFGLVPSQQVGTRQVTLTNSGGTACDVTAIALSPSTDPYLRARRRPGHLPHRSARQLAADHRDLLAHQHQRALGPHWPAHLPDRRSRQSERHRPALRHHRGPERLLGRLAQVAPGQLQQRPEHRRHLGRHGHRHLEIQHRRARLRHDVHQLARHHHRHRGHPAAGRRLRHLPDGHGGQGARHLRWPRQPGRRHAALGAAVERSGRRSPPLDRGGAGRRLDVLHHQRRRLCLRREQRQPLLLEQRRRRHLQRAVR